MEIFSEEFKAELSNQLEALTKVVEYKPKPMSDYEIAKSMEDCMDFTDNIKKERNKNNKKFKLDDVVYLGILQGRVKEVDEDLFMVGVKFINSYQQWFKNDGRLFQDSPKVLSHYPYELKKKKSKH
jgi:hypothetical protein